jgi:hypothetical protein
VLDSGMPAPDTSLAVTVVGPIVWLGHCQAFLAWRGVSTLDINFSPEEGAARVRRALCHQSTAVG